MTKIQRDRKREKEAFFSTSTNKRSSALLDVLKELIVAPSKKLRYELVYDDIRSNMTCINSSFQNNE
jgi:hypothetical protein